LYKIARWVRGSAKVWPAAAFCAGAAVILCLPSGERASPGGCRAGTVCAPPAVHAQALAGASQEGETRIVTDEADAALAILERSRAGNPVTARDWTRLFTSEGYQRLKQREESMGRAFSDSAFRTFLLADSVVAKAPRLRETLESWRATDLEGAARLARAYLPAGSRLAAALYPVIKPLPNSFVFEAKSRPAIFMYVDPEVSRVRLENTLAHELHHIGLASACAGAEEEASSEAVRTALLWASAFSEGVAVLAAAGGPEVHPHAVGTAQERERWDRDAGRVPEDLPRLEAFLLDVVDGRLASPDSVRAMGMSFFGYQGPWYTVGWTMAATIERAFGRERLVAGLCDTRRLFADYDAAARLIDASGETLPRWSPELLAKLAIPPATAPDSAAPAPSSP